MKATLTLIGLLLASVAHGQETTTVFTLDTGRIVSQRTRDLGMIYIERGNQGVLQTFPAEYYRGYGSGYNYRSHRFYGRSFRGYDRNR
jgi:predicted lipase